MIKKIVRTLPSATFSCGECWSCYFNFEIEHYLARPLLTARVPCELATFKGVSRLHTDAVSFLVENYPELDDYSSAFQVMPYLRYLKLQNRCIPVLRENGWMCASCERVATDCACIEVTVLPFLLDIEECQFCSSVDDCSCICAYSIGSYDCCSVDSVHWCVFEHLAETYCENFVSVYKLYRYRLLLIQRYDLCGIYAFAFVCRSVSMSYPIAGNSAYVFEYKPP